MDAVRLIRRAIPLGVPVTLLIATLAVVDTRDHATSLRLVASPVSGNHTIASAQFFSVVIGADGRPYGTGLSGPQLTSSAPGDITVLTPLTGLPDAVSAVAVSAGANDTLVLGSDGIAYGAGYNTTGQLTGSNPTVSTLTPLAGLPAGVHASAVAEGGNFSLVLGSNGVAYGAGTNSAGQLTGSANPVTTLTPLAGLPAGVSATAIAAGFNFSLVLGSDGIAYGAGSNSAGQLTFSATSGSLAPLAGPGVPVTAIAAGLSDSMVIGSDGSVYGTGDNAQHQISSAATTTYNSLTKLSGLPSTVQAVNIAAGEADVVVVGSDGYVYGEGFDSTGNLGGSTNPVTALTPFYKTLPTAAVDVAADVGNPITLVQDADGAIYGTGYNGNHQLTNNVTGSTAALTLLAGQPLVNTVRPSIGGTVAYGSSVTAEAGTWSQRPQSYSYQWYANGLLIPGATGQTYLPTLSTVGLALSVVVTAHRGLWVDGTATSAQSAPVADGPPPQWTASPAPQLRGVPRVGSTMHVINASLAGWSPPVTRLSYQWLRNGKPITHATNSQYVLTAADAGARVAVRIVSELAGYNPGSYTTPAVLVHKGAALKWAAAKKPAIHRNGTTLSVANLSKVGWNPDATSLSYQWMRGSMTIPHATKSTYHVSSADKGHRLSVRITASRAGYASGTYTTGPVSVT